jgi:L-alanine-DL-glutamate epimerase-like enolase superfamily enzyme
MRVTRLKTAVEGNVDRTFVRIETDEGLKGMGECFFAPGLTTLLRDLEPVLRGEDLRDIRRLFRKLQLTASGAGSVAGMVYNAISGIEAALWDLLGQWLGTPVYRLLGGRLRDRIRIYADCYAGERLESLDAVLRSRRPSWAPPDKHKASDFFEETTQKVILTPEIYAQRARAMAERGFTALKFDVDVPNPYRVGRYNRCLSSRGIDYMVSLVGAAREGGSRFGHRSGCGLSLAF